MFKHSSRSIEIELQQAGEAFDDKSTIENVVLEATDSMLQYKEPGATCQKSNFKGHVHVPSGSNLDAVDIVELDIAEMMTIS